MATGPESVYATAQDDTRNATRDPPVASMETDPELVHIDTQAGTKGCPAPRDGPHRNGWALSGRAGEAPIPTRKPRSRPRTTASPHSSGMWFCQMSRCARREEASPTGWTCLQSLVSHL